ncbi:MAG TPA: DMT family transporter [Devosiaceae bacterium]|jgi:drug/metabolite transporter (DMT)-like permease|nr:DMT family transporter [Devosiaceae bacterium]
MASFTAPREERRLLGIGFALVAFFCFTVIDSCAKWLTLSGLPPMQVVLIRYAGQVLLVSALFLPSRGFELVRTRSPRLELLRGVCLLSATVLNFSAIMFLPLTVIASIAFTMPLMLCALSIPFLGEHLGWRRWLAILTGFVGVLVIVQPGSDAFHPATFLSLASAFFTALYMLLNRKLAGVDAATTQQFYSAFIATVCILPFALGPGGWVWPADPAGWTAFIGIGAVALTGHQFITTAHRYAPASILAPFGYTQIIFMTASSWLIFNEPPDVWVFVGAPIVIGSGLYIWLRERQLARNVVTAVTAR